VYREGAILEGVVSKWCRFFKGGGHVHNEVRSGGLSVITEDLKDRVHAHVRENRR
jgi:hypothetical protein